MVDEIHLNHHLVLQSISPFRRPQDCIAAAEKAVQIFDGMGAEGPLTESNHIISYIPVWSKRYVYIMIIYDILCVN